MGARLGLFEGCWTWPAADHRETGSGAKRHVELCFISTTVRCMESNIIFGRVDDSDLCAMSS